MTRTLSKGSRIRVRRAGGSDEWSLAIIELISPNGKSVAARLLDGGVRTGDGGLIIGMLPLMIDYERETITGLMGEEYDLEYDGTADAGG